MTRTEAMKKGLRLFGKSFLFRVGPSVSSQDERAAATERMRAINAEREAISDEIQRRLQETPWHVELTGRMSALCRERKGLESTAHYYKFTVGRNEIGMFFVKGEGDTWEQAFEQAEKRDAKAS